jgi:hypothetical protein
LVAGDTTTTVPSGAIVLSASGQDPTTAALPCAAGATCSAAIKLPLPAPVAAAARRLLAQGSGVDYTCIRLASNTQFQAEPSTSAVVDTTSGSPTVTCTVTRAGTYLIAATPVAPPPSASPSPSPGTGGAGGDGGGAGGAVDQTGETAYDVPASTQPYAFDLRFVGMDYAEIMANTVERLQFRSDLVAVVAAATDIPRSSIQVRTQGGGAAHAGARARSAQGVRGWL